MSSKLRFAKPKLSFHRATRQKYVPEYCASNRMGSAQIGLQLFRSGQEYLLFSRATNFCVHETKLSRYHLNS
jgi:hypothetical protein